MKTIILFNHQGTTTELHEQLYHAIHGQDVLATIWLSENVKDIKIVEEE